MNFGDFNLGSEEVSFANAQKNNCGDDKQEASNHPIAEEVRHPPVTRALLGAGSGTNYPLFSPADSYCAGSGTNYPRSPCVDSCNRPGSGTNRPLSSSGAKCNVSPFADSHRLGSGRNYPSPSSADSYRPGSGRNYPLFPTAGSHPVGSWMNYPSPSSADSYRPGSGTNYSVSPTTCGVGAPARSADNDHVVH